MCSYLRDVHKNPTSSEYVVRACQLEGLQCKLSGFPPQDLWICSLGWNRFSRKDLSIFYLEGSAWCLYFEPRRMRLGTCVSTFTRFIYTTFVFLFLFSFLDMSPSLSRKKSLILFQGGKEAAKQSCGMESYLSILNKLSSHPVIFSPTLPLPPEVLNVTISWPLRGSVNVLTHPLWFLFFLPWDSAFLCQSYQLWPLQQLSVLKIFTAVS